MGCPPRGWKGRDDVGLTIAIEKYEIKHLMTSCAPCSLRRIKDRKISAQNVSALHSITATPKIARSP